MRWFRDLNGVGRVFVGRYLLDATSLEDAQRRLTQFSFAAGHNHQLLELATGKLIDLEVAPFGSVAEGVGSHVVRRVRGDAGTSSLAREFVQRRQCR